MNAWLASDKLLHVMRDHPHHYYKILGGMWGYKNYKQRLSITPLIHKFLQVRNYRFTRMDDMKFLDSVYDYCYAKKQTLEHDQYFSYPNSQPFPAEETTDTNRYYHFVGEIFNEHNQNPNYERNKTLMTNQYYKKVILSKPYR